MDKYIDEFCEKYFSEFEELGNENSNDEFFENPKMKPSWLFEIAFIVSLSLILLPRATETSLSLCSTVCGDVGIGMLSGLLVALFLECRDKSIHYYDEVIGIVNLRIHSVKEAREEANKRLMNESRREGLQLLQSIVRNTYHFAGYLEDRIGHLVTLDLVEGLSIELDLEDGLSDAELREHIRIARKTISELLLRLENAKIAIQAYALAGKSFAPRKSRSLRRRHQKRESCKCVKLKAI